MAGVFLVISAGGPALMYYVTPAEGELFKRFNPELQKRNLEMRAQREEYHNDFARKMIEYSKSDKPIWVAEEEDRKRRRQEILDREAVERDEKQKIAQAIKDEMKSGK